MEAPPIDLVQVEYTVSQAPFKYLDDVEVVDDTFDKSKCKLFIDYEKADVEETEFSNFKIFQTPQYILKNIGRLQAEFNNEIERKKISINGEEGMKAYNSFCLIYPLLAELPFKNSATEITSSGSLKYTLVFPNNKTLMVSKPFDKLPDVDTDQVVFSVFQNQDLVISNVAPISDLVSGFKELLPV